MGSGRRISQVALAPSPLCPRSLPRETDCIQTRGANCSRGARVQEPNYGHGALLRTHRDRPCSDRATEQADELASLHAPPEASSCWLFPPVRPTKRITPHAAAGHCCTAELRSGLCGSGSWPCENAAVRRTDRMDIPLDRDSVATLPKRGQFRST